MQTLIIDKSLMVKWQVRLANYVIDVIAIYGSIFILAIIGYGLTNFEIYAVSDFFNGLGDGGYKVLGFIIMLLYYFIMEATTQRTLGKYITGTMVVSEKGARPSIGSLLGRSLCRIFSFEVFSFFKEYPHGWHDSASGTYVVNTKKYKAALALKNSFEEIGLTAEI